MIDVLLMKLWITCVILAVPLFIMLEEALIKPLWLRRIAGVFVLGTLFSFIPVLIAIVWTV